MAETKRCAYCGREFDAQRSTAQYCSGRCRQAAMRDRHTHEVRGYAELPRIDNPDEVRCEELAYIVGDVKQAAYALIGCSKRAPYQLRAGCERVGTAILEALEVEGW